MYQVGQICIGQNFEDEPSKNEMECKIIEGIKERSGYSFFGEYLTIIAYKVEWENGEISCPAPEHLRPKHEPGSWDELEKMIGWRPSLLPFERVARKEKIYD